MNPAKCLQIDAFRVRAGAFALFLGTVVDHGQAVLFPQVAAARRSAAAGSSPLWFSWWWKESKSTGMPVRRLIGQTVGDAVLAVVVFHDQAPADLLIELFETAAKTVQAFAFVAIDAAAVDLNFGRQVQPQQIKDPGMVGQLGGTALEDVGIG